MSVVVYGFYPGNQYLIVTYGFGGYNSGITLSFDLSMNRVLEAELIR